MRNSTKMFQTLLTVLAICATVPGQQQEPSNAQVCIIGGLPTTIQRHPYQLSIRERDWHICGASIISSTWALTAAHCVKNKNLSSLAINAGTNDRTVKVSIHPVKTAIVHPSYQHIEYDFGLIEVGVPFPLGSPGIQLIELASVEPKEEDLAIVTGWGTTEPRGQMPNELYEVQIPIISRKKCNELYAKYYSITPRMLCAMAPNGGKDSCQGDSGGPLVVDNKLAGVVSDGIGCGSKDFAGIYSNVADQLHWIKKMTGL